MKPLIFFVFFATGCSSVETISQGKIYEVSCHRLFSSEEDCAEKVSRFCENGYKIKDSRFEYVFLKGPQRVIRISCKDQ
jgi:hypothetical protein